MKLFKYIIPVICLSAILAACKDDKEPSLADNFLNYQIPDVKATQDYLIGIDYSYTVTSYGATPALISLFSSPPVLGNYTTIKALTPDGKEQIVDAHLRWMNQAKIDYVILAIHSPTISLSSFKSDTSYVNLILNSKELKGIKFAFAYDLGSTYLGTTPPTVKDSSMIIEKKPNGVENYITDFETYMTPYFKMANYVKVDGKNLVFVKSAYRLYSRNNAALNDTLRKRLRAKDDGYELYITAMQQAWSPPARYEQQFKGAVDAIYHDSYANLPNNDLNRVFLFHQATDQAWKYSKAMFNSWGVDYVPNISPSWNSNLGAPNAAGTYYNPYIVRDINWFKTFCNVGKLNADKHHMIIITSWNNWQYTAEIEPSVKDSTSYLDVVKQQFKL